MPADPTQPVPGPTREQIAEAIVANIGRDCDDVNAAADAVLALLPARPSPTDDAARKALDDIFKAAAALARYQPFSGDDADRVSDQTLTNITAIAGRIADSRNLVLAEIERLREQNTALGVRIQQGWAEIERLRAQQGTT